MKNRILVAVLAIVAWVVVAPSAWMTPVQAQYASPASPVGGSNGFPVPYVNTATFSTTSASGTLDVAPGNYPNDTGTMKYHYQHWYHPVFVKGVTYVITMDTTGDSFMSLQHSGNYITYNDDANDPTLQSALASQITYVAQFNGVHTIICSTYSEKTVLTYTLSINQPYATTTTISPSPSFSVTSPSSASVTVSVTSPAAASANPSVFPVKGSVALSVDGGTSTNYPLSNGSATITFSQPSVGNHTITASFPTAGRFTGSSASTTLTVNPAPVTTTITINAPTVTYPSNGIITVSMNASSGTPTGTVTLSVDGGAGITQTLSGGASFTYTLASPSVGLHPISAVYTPQGNFAASSGSGVLLVLAPALGATATTITAPTVTYPSNGIITVSVSSSSGTPTGSVNLSVDSGAAIPLTLSGGSATYTMIKPNVGLHTLTATYAAQGGFAASSDLSGSLLVLAAQVATTTTINAPTVTYPSDGIVTVSVSSGSGTPSGSVALSVDGGAGIIQTLSGGSATYTLTSPAVGVHTLSAAFTPQGNFNASSGTGSLTVLAAQVQPPAATTTTISAPPITSPSSASITVRVSSASGTPTGNVTLTVDGGAGVTQTLVNGSTTIIVPFLAPGNHPLSATYTPLGNFLSSSGTGNQLVNAPNIGAGIPNVQLSPPPEKRREPKLLLTCDRDARRDLFIIVSAVQPRRCWISAPINNRNG